MHQRDLFEVCMICGEPATQIFGGSKILPLCPLRSCEVALIHEINGTVETTEPEVELE